MITNLRRGTAALLFTAAAFSVSAQLHAQVWDGGHPSSDNWSSGRNWDPDGPPADDGSANIIMSGTVRLTPIVDDPWDIKSLKFNASAGAFVTSGSPLIVRDGIENDSNNLQVFDNKIFPRGSQTWGAFSAPMVFNDLIEGFIGQPALTIDGAHNVTFNGNLAESGVTLELTKTGAGTLTLNGTNNTYTGSTTVNTGKMLLATNLTTSQSIAVTGGTLELAAGGASNRVIKTGSVSVTGSGKLDLKDNKAVVTSAPIGSWNGSSYSGVTGMIQNGRGDGSWNGNGIITSVSDATSGVLTTLAVARADETEHDGGTFGGVSVSGDDVLVMYTWGGDADLNGELNGDDYFYIDSNILAVQSGATELLSFHNGDFNYDGAVNGDDYFVLDSNILQAQGSSPFPTGAGVAGLVSVPEPGAASVLVAAGAMVGARRRRRRAPSV